MKNAYLSSGETSLSMQHMYYFLVMAMVFCLQAPAFAQAEHPVTKAFSSAIRQGDAKSLSALLDEEVELVHPGTTGTFRKQTALGKLSAFFQQNPPLSFLMKHQGASADGQVYAIGQLTMQSGQNYKVLLRAKPSGNQYLIFKLDLSQSL